MTENKGQNAKGKLRKSLKINTLTSKNGFKVQESIIHKQKKENE